MKFGKLENGVLLEPPGMLDGVERTFPPEEEGGEPITGLYRVGYDPENTPDYVEAYLRENGWLPVYETMPTEPAGEGKHYEARGWAEGVNQQGDPAILRTWAIVDDPDPMDEEISAAEALDIIFGGDENAVD